MLTKAKEARTMIAIYDRLSRRCYNDLVVFASAIAREPETSIRSCLVVSIARSLRSPRSYQLTSDMCQGLESSRVGNTSIVLVAARHHLHQHTAQPLSKIDISEGTCERQTLHSNVS